MPLGSLLFSFRGVISRRAYIAVAGPILLALALRPLWIPLLPVWIFQLGYSVGTSALLLTVLIVATYLLLIPLLAISFKRLHDLGRSGLWSLPYLLLLVPTVAAFAYLAAVGQLFRMRDHEWMQLVADSAFYYGLVLAILLAVAPGKSTSAGSAKTEP